MTRQRRPSSLGSGRLPRSAQALEFITLTSGGVVMSRRSEVGEDVIAHLAAGGAMPSGWGVEWEQAPPGAAIFTVLHDGIRLSRNILCWDAAASDAAWEVAEPLAPEGVVLHRPRGAPWLAVALLFNEPGFVTATKETLMALADAERCVAWGKLARVSRG